MATIYRDNYVAPAAKGTGAGAATIPLTAADHGKLYTNKGATGTVTFQLPALADVPAGWFVEIYAMTAAQNVTVTAPTGKLVAFNNAAATSLTFSASSAIIGNSARIVSTGAEYLAITSMPVSANETIA